MRASSAKAKGRRLQQLVAERLRTAFGLHEADVWSTPGGCAGEDVRFSTMARERIGPWSFECKNTEKLNLWAAFEQCVRNAGAHNRPLVVFKRNHSEVLCALRFADFLTLLAASADATGAESAPPESAPPEAAPAEAATEAVEEVAAALRRLADVLEKKI